MVQSNESASDSQQGAKSSAERKLKIQDGLRSVSVFNRSRDDGAKHQFVVPERAYRDKNKKLVNTHILHEEDLLPMAALLVRVYEMLRHQQEEADE